MARYSHQDISFDPPHTWFESTVARFHGKPAPPGAPPAPCITMEHEPLARGMTVRTHAAQWIEELEKTLRGFKLMNRDETTIGGRPAILVRFRFDQDKSTMEQVVAMIAGGSGPQPHLVVLSLGCPWSAMQASMPVFRKVLESVRFEQPWQAEPATAKPSTPPGPALSPTASKHLVAAARAPDLIEMPMVPMPGSRR